MPSPSSKSRQDNRFQPFDKRARSTLQKSIQVQEVLSDNRVLATFPTGEQVLRLGGQRKCLPCLIAKKGAVFPLLTSFLTVVSR